MSPLDGKHRWMFVVETAILFSGIFLTNSICESTDTKETCQQKNVLLVSAKQPDQSFYFPSEVVDYKVNGTLKLCFNITKTHADCCHQEGFNCSFEMSGPSNNYSVILSKETLSKQDIVLMSVPDHNFNCMPSNFYNSSGFLLNIDKCLDSATKNIRLSQNSLCGNSSPYDEEACQGLGETMYKLTIVDNKRKHCVSCKQPEKKPDFCITVPPSEINNGTSIRPEHAAYFMKNLSFLLEKMGPHSTAAIKMGNITGAIIKLDPKYQTNISVGIATNGDVNIPKDNSALETGFSRLLQIPEEASAMAVKKNSSFAGLLLFPGMYQDNPNSFLFNNEVVGIEMGTEISNLSHTIDIHYRNVDKNGNIASCKSWDGKAFVGKEPIWITDGCKTKETNDSITCQCSHLTFFAILLSAPPKNISSSDFTSLTYITSVGCGVSIFFLAVALFMHCLIRKGKASQTTKILMNLFVAMFTLNFSFLINESIANLEILGACMAMAAVMHYSMLATLTWFFIEALHLYFNLWRLPTEIKHYMMKICVTGWVTPAVVVIAFLACGKYNLLVIYTNDGNSSKMCWIPDAVLHQGLNVGYYAIVFILTFSIFIITVRQIVIFKPTAGKAQDISSIKTNSFSILGLFLLLGITWAFAFFSHGPLLIASYYIFTILNSFQGFFLFIYYYNSSKIVGENRNTATVSSSSTATPNTYVTSPYQ